jgi:hypothetical protein
LALGNLPIELDVGLFGAYLVRMAIRYGEGDRAAVTLEVLWGAEAVRGVD